MSSFEKRLQCNLTGGVNCGNAHKGSQATQAQGMFSSSSNKNSERGAEMFTISADQDQPENTTIYSQDQAKRINTPFLDANPNMQVNIQDVCVDCSMVDENTFRARCTGDSNVAVAIIKFAKCGAPHNTSGTRDIRLDQGTRQTDSTSERDPLIQYNMTNTSNIDSSQGTSAAPGVGAMYAYGSRMYENRISGSSSSGIFPASATLAERSAGPVKW